MIKQVGDTIKFKVAGRLVSGVVKRVVYNGGFVYYEVESNTVRFGVRESFMIPHDETLDTLYSS